MSEKKINDNMILHGPVVGAIVSFALPLFIGNLFQQLYNTADALIVGNLLGNSALASVTATGNLVWLLVGFFEGIAIGAGVVVSRYFGAGDYGTLKKVIYTDILFSLAMGIVLTIFGTLFTPAILRLMGTPEDIFDTAADYIRIYFAGGIGLVMYNSLRGILQAVGDSRHPLIYLVVSSVTNIVLDILFIAVFHGGVGSAAVATIISQFISALLCLRKLLKSDGPYTLCISEMRADFSRMKEIVHYGLPTGLQNSAIAIANVVVQSNINAFGTMAVSGCGSYSKIEGFAFLPITSFVMAITTFVGQNLGARQYARAKKGSGAGVIFAMGIAELIGAVIYVSAPVLIRAFTSEPEAIAFGVQKARICSVFYFLLAASHSLSAVLRGAGKPTIPMITMFAVWCVIRVSILAVFVPIFKSILIVNWVYPITWCISTVVLALYYFKSDWIHGFENTGRM